MKKRSSTLLGMAFFVSALVLLTIFLFVPMALTLAFSFTDYFALNPDLTHFVGLENYIKIFKDDLFVRSFVNTVSFVRRREIGAFFAIVCASSMALSITWSAGTT